MRIFKVFLAVLTVMAFLYGCGEKVADPNINTNPESQTSQTGEGFLTAESLVSQIPCQVRLIREMRNVEFPYMLCLEVDIGTQLLKKELTLCGPYLEEKLYFADLDGDRVQEIVIHHNTGGNGGFGAYISWVIKVTEDDICIVLEAGNSFDTGFKGGAADGYQLMVQHPMRNYELLFDAKQNHKTYFDNNGKVNSDAVMMFDSFYEFSPVDQDEDGVFELHCKQYTSLYDHADHVGSACSVWKWNKEASQFEIIDAWFEPNTEE